MIKLHRKGILKSVDTTAAINKVQVLTTDDLDVEMTHHNLIQGSAEAYIKKIPP